MSDISIGRRTQVAKGKVCKTFIQRFESARRLQINPSASSIYEPSAISTFFELGNIWEGHLPDSPTMGPDDHREESFVYQRE
jgi:hypothetical protein